MARETYYFSHDCNAFFIDEKIADLKMDHKLAGVAVFWTLIEMLRQAKDYRLEFNPRRIAFQIGCDCTKEMVEAVISKYRLFEVRQDPDGLSYFHSPSLLRRMDFKDSKGGRKSEVASKNAKARWEKKKNTENSDGLCEDDANVCEENAVACNGDAKLMQLHDANMPTDAKIKEKKIKERDSILSSSRGGIENSLLKGYYQEYPLPYNNDGEMADIPEPRPNDTYTEWMRYNGFLWVKLYTEILSDPDPERPLPPNLNHDIIRKVEMRRRELKGGINDYIRALEMVKDNDYLNQSRDTIGFGWFLKEGNIDKVLKGHFKPRKNKPSQPQATNTDRDSIKPNLHPDKKWENTDLPKWEPDEQALRALSAT